MTLVTDVDLLVQNTSEVLTCAPAAPDRVGRIPGGAVAIRGDRIVATSAGDALRQRWPDAPALDARGGVVMPGFVDSHTHVIFGGNRVDEYLAKATGGDLAAVRAAGKPVGIVGTVVETRQASEADLVESALPRIEEMLRHGTTTVESKSGYGLTTADELKMLRAGRGLARRTPAEIVNTFLGAHAIPPDEPDSDRYVGEIVERMLPTVVEEDLAVFCDAYCEEGYFDIVQTRRILAAASAAGMKIKLHLDQYTHTGAAKYLPANTVSVDHLNYTTDRELADLAARGIVAVAMPGIDYMTAHPHPVDIPRLLAAGLDVALATDYCPGGPIASLPLIIGLAVRMHAMPVAEAVRAATLGGAKALAIEERVGSLEVGKQADLLVLDVDRYEEIPYLLGHNPVRMVIKRGRIVVGEDR
jgi:imidazolonepropionase